MIGTSSTAAPLREAPTMTRQVVPLFDVENAASSAGPLVCRVCLLSGDDNTLIAPCACTGFDKYVHRACLDRVRVNAARPQNVYNCEKCKVDYRLYPKSGETTTQRHRRARFHALVLRDFFVVFCLIQLAIVLIGTVIRGIDNSIAYCVPECQPTETNSSVSDCTVCPPIKTLLFPQAMEDHDRITYYVCGIIGFLAIIGFFGLCNSCCKWIESPAPVVRQPRHSAVYYSHRGDCCSNCYCDCSNGCDGCCRNCCDCDCEPRSSRSNGDCKCESNGNSSDSGGIIILVAIVVIMFAIVGVFYGIVLATALFQRIVQRHMHTLELRLLTADYPVADLAEPLNDNIPYAQIVADVREMV